MIIYLLYSIFINKSIDKLLVLLGQIRNNDPDYVVSAMIQHKLLMHFYFYHKNNARAISRMKGTNYSLHDIISATLSLIAENCNLLESFLLKCKEFSSMK